METGEKREIAAANELGVFENLADIHMDKEAGKRMYDAYMAIMYMEKDLRNDLNKTLGARENDYIACRLMAHWFCAAGANMLRDLFYTLYERSAFFDENEEREEADQKALMKYRWKEQCDYVAQVEKLKDNANNRKIEAATGKNLLS